jgi:hypothetical protein
MNQMLSLRRFTLGISLGVIALGSVLVDARVALSTCSRKTAKV